MVLNPETGHVSPQLHVVFDDEFYHSSVLEGRHNTSELERSCTTQLTKWCTGEYIDLKDTWFTPQIEEDPRETRIQRPSIDPQNVTSLQFTLHVQEGLAS